MQLISTNINLMLGCFFEVLPLMLLQWLRLRLLLYSRLRLLLYYHSPKLKLLNEFIPQPHCCKRAYFFSRLEAGIGRSSETG